MSTQRLPHQIDPFRLARQEQILTGALELKTMHRLAESLSDSGGTVNVELAFGIDAQGVAHVRGHLAARVRMVCQRCMQPVELPVTADIMIGFVTSDEQARQLGGEYEPCMVSDDSLILAELVEDELILALPIVALHDDASCEPILARLQAESERVEHDHVKPNPFAVLSVLKGEK